LTEEEQSQPNSLEGIVLKEATFVKVLEYLSRHFSVVSLDTFLANTARDAHPSKPLCLITFDDGWRDTYTTAYPWLRKFALPATVFLTTGLVEGRGVFWFERLARAWTNPSRRAQIQARLRSLMPAKDQITNLEAIIEYLKHMRGAKRKQVLGFLLLPEERHNQWNKVDQMLTWDQVIEMNRHGIDFGSHTVTHPLLTYEDDVAVKHELGASKVIIEKKLNKEVQAFAYPNGDRDDCVRRHVKQAGYQCAFSTHGGWHCNGYDMLDIRRILIHEGNVTGRSEQFSPSMFNLTLGIWR
jgi:peptidoglycan/xylan/chitin deacetylase (PgdA/CDA1 family)